MLAFAKKACMFCKCHHGNKYSLKILQKTIASRVKSINRQSSLIYTYLLNRIGSSRVLYEYLFTLFNSMSIVRLFMCMFACVWVYGLWAWALWQNAHICLPSRLKIRFLAPIFRAKMSFTSPVYVLLLHNMSM